MPANQTAWRHPPGAPHPVSAVRDEGQGWSRRLSRLRSSRGAAWGWSPPLCWPEPAWSPPRGRCPGCNKHRRERGEPWVHRGRFLGIPARSSLSPISAPPSLRRARPALPRAAPKPAGKGRKALFRAERCAVQEDRLLLLAEIPSCRWGLLREAPTPPTCPPAARHRGVPIPAPVGAGAVGSRLGASLPLPSRGGSIHLLFCSRSTKQRPSAASAGILLMSSARARGIVSSSALFTSCDFFVLFISLRVLLPPIKAGK